MEPSKYQECQRQATEKTPRSCLWGCWKWSREHSTRSRPQITDKEAKGKMHGVGTEDGGRGPSGESSSEMMGLGWGILRATHSAWPQKVFLRHITHPCNNCS